MILILLGNQNKFGTNHCIKPTSINKKITIAIAYIILCVLFIANPFSILSVDDIFSFYCTGLL